MKDSLESERSGVGCTGWTQAQVVLLHPRTSTSVTIDGLVTAWPGRQLTVGAWVKHLFVLKGFSSGNNALCDALSSFLIGSSSWAVVLLTSVFVVLIHMCLYFLESFGSIGWYCLCQCKDKSFDETTLDIWIVLPYSNWDFVVVEKILVAS